MIEAAPSIRKNAIRTKVSEKAPIRGDASSITPTTIPSTADNRDHQKPGACRIQNVVTRPTILFGWLFLVSGIVGLVTTFWMRHAPGFWWSLLSAVLGIVVGVMLLASPLIGAFSLTLVLIAFFLIEGAASIMFALDHRRELSGQWVWMLVSGIIDLGLALMIFAGLPSTAAWAVGLLVGINMIFGGAALIAMSLHARKGT